MTSERKPRERHYATKAKVRQYVEAARELGIEVGGFEVTPDGTIRVSSVAALAEKSRPLSKEEQTAKAYDEWKAGQGR